jgi:hypothetical protein
MKAVNGHKFADEELALLAEGCRDDPIVALRQHCARLCINLDKALTRIEELEGTIPKDRIERLEGMVRVIQAFTGVLEYPFGEPVLVDFGEGENE